MDIPKTDGSTETLSPPCQNKCEFGELAGDGLRRFVLVRLTRESLRDSEIRPFSESAWASRHNGELGVTTPTGFVSRAHAVDRAWASGQLLGDPEETGVRLAGGGESSPERVVSAPPHCAPA